MSSPAVCVEALGKCYRIGERERYLALRDLLARSATAPLRWLRNAPVSPSAAARDFWALKDVSLTAEQGEVLGIIGRNGAGKSTLLKILAGVTDPTTGRGHVRGRVGSLLEVGTGFHPELTGRENLFLSGAILGMSKREIRRKFDDIVSFAEVERFIDTPVKHYSSGMYMRLAFSVAAHLEPEILLVDEVLAVGDADFQRKCLGKMDGLGKRGWTVLIVSHNMAIIKTIAERAVWLNGGRVQAIGPAKTVADAYLSSSASATLTGTFAQDHIAKHRVAGPQFAGQLLVTRIELRNASGQATGSFYEGTDLQLNLTIQCTEPQRALRVSAPVSTIEGQVVFRCDPGIRYLDMTPGEYRAAIDLNLGPLMPGIYRGELILENTKTTQDRILSAFEFEIMPQPPDVDDPYLLLYDSSTDPAARRSDMSLIRLPSCWHELRPVQPGDAGAAP